MSFQPAKHVEATHIFVFVLRWDFFKIYYYKTKVQWNITACCHTIHEVITHEEICNKRGNSTVLRNSVLYSYDRPNSLHESYKHEETARNREVHFLLKCFVSKCCFSSSEERERNLEIDKRCIPS